MGDKKAYKKNEIPYATQLFTPDWIVKYLVENTIGKYWIEHQGNKDLIKKWNYFIDEQLVELKEKTTPEKIKFLDPCCGSGHILVYAFEILYQIYDSVGYNKKDIPEKILKNNLYGLLPRTLYRREGVLVPKSGGQNRSRMDETLCLRLR